MPKILDETQKEISEGGVLMRYFRLPNQSMQEFYQELKALTPADKTELALGAAKELNLTIVP